MLTQRGQRRRQQQLVWSVTSDLFVVGVNSFSTPHHPSSPLGGPRLPLRFVVGRLGVNPRAVLLSSGLPFSGRDFASPNEGCGKPVGREKREGGWRSWWLTLIVRRQRKLLQTTPFGKCWISWREWARNPSATCQSSVNSFVRVCVDCRLPLCRCSCVSDASS